MAPAFGDLDADGDDDLLLGTWNKGVALLVNVGTPLNPSFTVTDSQFVKLTRGSHSTPTLGDLDGDGDLDLFIGEASGTLNYYRNEGTPEAPRFELVSDEYGDFDVGRRSAPTLVDADGDQDLDLLVGRETGGLAFFRNVGTPTAPEFVEAEAPLPPLWSFATPSFGDLDGDGDLDLVSGSGAGGALYVEAR